MGRAWLSLGALGAALALTAAGPAAARAVVLATPQPAPAAGVAPTGPAADEARRLNAQALALIQQKQYDPAEKLLQQTLAICDGALHGEHYCVAGATLNLALIAEARGDLFSAETFITRAGAVTFAARGRQDLQFGDISLKLGRMLVMEGKYRQAEPVLTTGLDIRSHAGDGRGAMIGVLDLAQVYRATQRLPQAENLLRQLFPICPHADPTCEATTRGRLGEILWSLDRHDEAEAELRKAADLYGALGKQDAKAGSQMTLADLFVEAGLFAQAEPLFKAVMAFAAANPATTSANISDHELDLARVYVLTGRNALAEPLLKDATARVAGGAMTPLEAAAVEVRASRVLMLTHRFSEAGTLLERAAATPTPGLSLPPWWKVEAEGVLGDIATFLQRPKDAEALYRKASDDYANASDLGQSRRRQNDLAAALMDQHRLAEAEVILRALLPPIQALQPPSPRSVAMIKGNLARAANERLDFKAAEVLAAEAVAEQEKAPPPPVGVGDSQMAGLLTALGQAEEGQGKFAAAEIHLRASLKVDGGPRSNPVYRTSVRDRLCGVLAMAGKFADEMACVNDLAVEVDAWPDAPVALKINVLLARGNALIEEGRYPEARDTYLKAKALYPAGQAPDRQLGIADQSLGQAYAFSGEPQKAVVALNEAHDIFAKVGLGDQQEGVEAARRLGDADVTLGRAKEAEPLIRAAVIWFEAHIGPDHPRTATQYRSLGLALTAQARPLEAEAAFKRALAIRQAGVSPNLSPVAQSLGDLAECEKRLARFDQARDLLRQAETTEAAARGKASWTVGEVARDLGELDAEQGRYADAEADYKRAAPLIAAGGPPLEREVLQLQNDIGWLDEAQGRYADARRVFEDNLAREDKAPRPDTGPLIDTLTALGTLDRNAGRFDPAAGRFKRVLEVAGKAYGETSTRLEWYWLDLAGVQADAGRATEAEQAVSAALALQRAGPGLEDGSSVFLLTRAADLYGQIGKQPEAQDAAARALALARAHPGDAGRGLIAALLAEAASDRRAKKYADAEAELAEALAKSRALWGEGSAALLTPLAVAGGVQLDIGRGERAEELFAQAAAIAAKQLPPDHLTNAYLANDLAQAYIAEDKPAKAETTLKPLLVRLTRQGEPASLVAAYAEITLAKAYTAQNRPVEAEGALAAARKLLGATAPLKPAFAEPDRH